MIMNKKILPVPAIIIWSGCHTLQPENIDCRNIVEIQVPVITEQRYSKSETVCNNKGAIVDITKGSTMNCEAKPVFETVVANKTQRDNAYAICVRQHSK
jgi:hypothetical protein